MVLIYQHNKVMEFFTPELIMALWECDCQDCPNKTLTATIIGKIRGKFITTKLNGKIRQLKATYVGVLAFLLVEILDIRPIVKFMERGFSDQSWLGLGNWIPTLTSLWHFRVLSPLSRSRRSTTWFRRTPTDPRRNRPITPISSSISSSTYGMKIVTRTGTSTKTRFSP